MSLNAQEQAKYPAREDIILAQRNDLCAQLMNAEADKVELAHEIIIFKQKIAELENLLLEKNSLKEND